MGSCLAVKDRKGGVRDDVIKPSNKPKGKQIDNKDQIDIKASDFIQINEEPFKKFYKVGPELGRGAFGEV